MSRWLLGKLHIDVLVSVALVGPLERSARWRSFTFQSPQRTFGQHDLPVSADTVDHIGESLWRMNERAAGDGQKRDPYVFEPVGCPISAIEGLKAVSCYEYQTNGVRGWSRSDARAFCEALRANLVGVVPGFDDAPWGWSSRDVEQRVHRGEPPPAPRPRYGPVDEPDARLVLEALATLRPYDRPFGEHSPRVVEERLSVGSDLDDYGTLAQPLPTRVWEASMPSDQSLWVFLFPDESVAQDAFRMRRVIAERARLERGWIMHADIFRIGRVVVRFRYRGQTYMPGIRSEPVGEPIANVLEGLGVDEVYSTAADPASAIAAGRVTARRLAIRSGSRGWVSVARTKADVQRLQETRGLPAEALADVDPRRHTVLLFTGPVDIDAVGGGALRAVLAPALQGAKEAFELELAVRGVQEISGVVAVIDRLSHYPFRVVLRDRDTGSTRVYLAARP
jgi:hypothetical protein